LEFLLAHGLTLRREWTERPGRHGKTALAAEVGGAIPVAGVLDRFARAGAHVLSVSCLEVRPNFVRVVGLSFEEYFIDASAA
jgi:hypothetical protein